jgi:hypothetical protein
MIDLALSSPIREIAPGTSWNAIHDRDVELLIAPRAPLLARGLLERVRDGLVAPILFEGALDTLPGALDGLPALLAADVMALATRFAALIGSDAIRLRLEVITGNACRKWHRDYTNLRLVLTYLGPGTEYRLGEDPSGARVPEQAAALFKGRLAEGCAGMVEHRSPPIEGSGARRLVLVLDGPWQDRPAIPPA